MKSAEITPGLDYEASRYGTLHRCTVLSVERQTRIVHSSARWDTNGHHTTGPVVTVRWDVGGEGKLTPQQVKRLWADAEPEHDAAAALTARTAAAVAALRAAGLDHARASLTPGRITVGLDVAAAEALAARLTEVTP